MPENELEALDAIITDHNYSGQMVKSHLTRIIMRLCDIKFSEAKELIDEHRVTDDYSIMNWATLRMVVTTRMTRTNKINGSVENLDKNWAVLGYDSYLDAIIELRERFGFESNG